LHFRKASSYNAGMNEVMTLGNTTNSVNMLGTVGNCIQQDWPWNGYPVTYTYGFSYPLLEQKKVKKKIYVVIGFNDGNMKPLSSGFEDKELAEEIAKFMNEFRDTKQGYVWSVNQIEVEV
jgi:hypothetical protein